MGAQEQDRQLILRAELIHDGRPVVGHTATISERSVFVLTDEAAYTGDSVTVRLSFPGLVDPFTLQAHVVSRTLSRGPGEPGGWTLAFAFQNNDEETRLRELLLRIDTVDEHQAEAGSYRVLLVEDNEMTRDVFSYRLEKYFRGRDSSVVVDIAEDGQEAWDMLRDSQYDLAIVDYFLPKINGDWLIARLRLETQYKDLPVVAVSMGGEEARRATLAAGADFFLDKPIVLKNLFSTLERLVRTRGDNERSETQTNSHRR